MLPRGGGLSPKWRTDRLLARRIASPWWLPSATVPEPKRPAQATAWKSLSEDERMYQWCLRSLTEDE